MSRQNVLVISRNEVEGAGLAKKIAQDSNYDVFLETNPKKVLERMKYHTLQAVIMSLNKFGLPQVALIDQIRAQKYKFKIIVLADKVLTAAHASVEDLPNVAVIDRSFINIDHEFVGFLKRAITQERIVKRTTKRHNTKQNGVLKHPRSGESFNVAVFNLSKTGAYLEFAKGHLNIRDKIQLIIPLSELNKTHAMSATVVWFEVYPDGRRAAGIAFSGRALSSN